MTAANANPEISVIIPYLNQPEFLENCLRSLRQQQTACQFEIIVVDNGSREVPTQICARYENVKLARESTPGPGPARNLGIQISTAPTVAFIDADCIADDGWLKSILSAFEHPATQIIGGDVRIALASAKNMTMLEAYESVFAYRQKMYIERQGFSGTGNLAMRRTAYEAIGPFAGIGVAEDRDWGKRATAKGYKIRYMPEMRVFHPARKTFAELCVKWGRHLAHDYKEQVRSIYDIVKWIGKAAALAASPVWEIARIVRSDRLPTLRSRGLAWICLCRIRFFRFKQMISLVISSGSTSASKSWNR